MVIHIGRAGLKLGAFSVFEVRQGLASGRFLPTDLGWKEGMAEWIPLAQFDEFAPEQPPLPEMPPLPGEAAGGQAPAIIEGDRAGVPWERRKENGLFFGFFETLWMVLFNPTAAFSRMRITGSMADPLLYNLLGGWVGLIMCGVYFYLQVKLNPAGVKSVNDAWHGMFNVTPQFALDELRFMTLMGPLMVTVGSVFCAGMAHVFLMLFGGANKPFHVTLRVVCYSVGSAWMLQLIPACGNIFAPVWTLIACVIGLAVAHETTTGRTMAAMGLFLACTALCCAAVMTLGMSAGGIPAS